ncbi:MAG TPA: hypothetical protein VK205_14755, partial [Prolixibacteraceae bacterium]|nr:hypothetical protein [Prolixibacteraceae bacterium]
MKNILLYLCLWIVTGSMAIAQSPVTPAMPGYDIYRETIPHGTIDTIAYPSKTVGNSRKAL